VYFIVTSIKTLEEKRGTPLPGIPSVSGVKLKSKNVDKIQKEDKLELLERRPAPLPLPSIHTSNDASVEIQKIQELKCPVIVVMGMCMPMNNFSVNFHLISDIIKLNPCILLRRCAQLLSVELVNM